MRSENLEKLSCIVREKGQPFRILIVDDEPWIRDVFQDFCELTDSFEVDMASSGDEAIDKMNTGNYDLVTMDLIMPEMSGLETLVKIKDMAPRVPIMVITGNATEKLINQAGVLGACRVMHKPVMLDDFIAGLTATLTRSM